MSVFFTLIGASMTAMAITDSTGDLYHYIEDETDPTGWSYEAYTGDKPNIDITDISYTTTDTQLTITMTVAGEIEDKQGLVYYAYVVRDTVGAGNLAYYTNSLYYVWGDTAESATSDMESRAGSDAITFTIDYADPAGITGVWGFTYEAADFLLGTSGEYWGDWAPDTYFPAYAAFYETDDATDDDTTDDDATDDDTTDDDATDEDTTDDDATDDSTGDTTEEEDSTGDSGTPGFELLTVVAAIGVALILLRKKK